MSAFNCMIWQLQKRPTSRLFDLFSNTVAAHPVDALGSSRLSNSCCQKFAHGCLFNNRKACKCSGMVQGGTGGGCGGGVVGGGAAADASAGQHLLASCGRRCTSTFGLLLSGWRLLHIEIACLGSSQWAARIVLCPAFMRRLNQPPPRHVASHASEGLSCWGAHRVCIYCRSNKKVPEADRRVVKTKRSDELRCQRQGMNSKYCTRAPISTFITGCI